MRLAPLESMNTNTQVARRIPELDGLRGLAILLVVFYHYVFSSLKPEDDSLPAKFIHAVFPLSWSGVDLFFVLSGFLIGGILMDYRNREHYYKTFYIRRICRIFPLYFLWLALFFVFPILFSAHAYSDWRFKVFLLQIPHFPKWGYALFLQNFYTAKTGLPGSSWLGATWSLAVEEQFYLLLPLVICLISPRKFPVVLIFLILLVPAFRLFLYLYHPAIFMHGLLPCRADTLLLGVLCAYLVRQEKSRYWLEKNLERLYLALTVLLLGMGGLTIFSNGTSYPALFSRFSSLEMISFGYSLIALFYSCLLLVVVIGQDGTIASIMRFSLLRYFGTIAYGVFLMHLAVNDSAHGLIFGKDSTMENLSDAVVTSVAFLTTLFLATISWRFLEKPIIAWGHSFLYGKYKVGTAK